MELDTVSFCHFTACATVGRRSIYSIFSSRIVVNDVKSIMVFSIPALFCTPLAFLAEHGHVWIFEIPSCTMSYIDFCIGIFSFIYTNDSSKHFLQLLQCERGFISRQTMSAFHLPPINYLALDEVESYPGKIRFPRPSTMTIEPSPAREAHFRFFGLYVFRFQLLLLQDFLEHRAKVFYVRRRRHLVSE